MVECNKSLANFVALFSEKDNLNFALILFTLFRMQYVFFIISHYFSGEFTQRCILVYNDDASLMSCNISRLHLKDI